MHGTIKVVDSVADRFAQVVGGALARCTASEPGERGFFLFLSGGPTARRPTAAGPGDRTR